jgi:hypothetical protein
MLPSDVFAKLLDIDRRTGRILVIGLACIAAGAIAASWGFQADMAIAAGYILGFALIALTVAFIATNTATRKWLGWTLTGCFTVYMLGLVDSAFKITHRLPSPPCYLRIFIEHPDACERRLAPVVQTIGGTGNAALAPVTPFRTVSGADRLWRAQAATPAYSGGPIYLQFGGQVSRDRSAALASTLAEAGWTIEGDAQGGEEMVSLPDRNEVRFFDPAGEEAALRLAHAIHDAAPGSEIAVRDFTRLAGKAPPGLLEIWLVDLGRAS